MRLKALVLAFMVSATFAVACSSDDDDDGNVGGSTGKGGSGASAGHAGAPGGAAGKAGSGAAGGRGGNAGAGGTGDGCPAFIFGAEGDPCSPEGKICGDGANDPCEFGNAIVCTDGVWERQEAFPDPNCGGQGGGGAAGQGGSS